MVSRMRQLIAFVGLAFLVSAPSAAADSNLFVGVTEDAFRWRSVASVSVARDLGLPAFRVSLGWSPGQTELAPADADAFDAMVPAAAGLRVVVTVFGAARSAPADDVARDAFCMYTRALLERYPTINDVVIWNEANLGFFWQPQFTPAGTSVAPASYQALLARCWDVLHAFRPGVNVLLTTSPGGNDNAVAVSNVSHSPGAFVRKVGDAHRASGRTARIFDNIGHNPFGASSAEPPWRRHLDPSHIAQGDVDRLVQAFEVGFRGTSQPVPGRCTGTPLVCASIWYLEAGYQTEPPSDRHSSYFGRENDARPIPDGGSGTSAPSQAKQLIHGIQLAYCQPHVGAFLNFLLWDEADLARWQSGVLWADGSPKASFGPLRQVVAEVHEDRVDCAKVKARQATPSAAGGDALVERLEWSALRRFSAFNTIWTFAVAARADARFRATVFRAGTRRVVLAVAGTLKRSHPRTVRFPERQLRPGSYRIELLVSRARLTIARRSPVFVVE